MRTKLITLITLLMMTSLNVSAAIEKQTLSVAEEVLFQRMFLEKTLFMPQVKVFNKQGVLLYGTNKADEELKVNMLKGLSEITNKGENKFDSHLKGITTADGAAINLDDFKQEIIVVESYVDWFEGSKKQRKDIEQVLSKVQNKDVLWLVLDVDPKKMANASVTVTHIE